MLVYMLYNIVNTYMYEHEHYSDYRYIKPKKNQLLLVNLSYT